MVGRTGDGLSPSAQRRGADRALCLPTFSHFLIVNKLLSLYLSLSLSLSNEIEVDAMADHYVSFSPFLVQLGI